MLIQDRDGSLFGEISQQQPHQDQQPQGYYVQAPASLLEEQHDLVDLLIGFAFDTLGALHLELRIRETE